MNILKTSIGIALATVITTAQATALDQARVIENKSNTSSAISQQKIDKSAEATLAYKAEIEQLQEEVKNLAVYRDHLTGLVNSQQQEMVSLNDQIDTIKETRQGVVPLMYKMLSGLTTLVEQDKPIKTEERLHRISKLEHMMTRADVSDAEKYRRLLEAYQIEMDYGTKLGTYQTQIIVEDNEQIDADMLHLGRVSLLARRLDASQYWSWNTYTNQWEALDSEFNDDLAKAYSVAYKQVAPSLLTLPVSLSLKEVK
ncbi:DUF3450 family protein [Aliivibrio fischeri]|uniref:DUF3450 domain-containing protein n=1 Tax=Aliivibrio fischeri TaxID=668 RepID=UPI0012DA8CE2|nr:DUF3450 domain-containing protein [Aliivibrio fischeri]MUK43638.1 DUF3450 family protein [Aliivibrio fischeri]